MTVLSKIRSFECSSRVLMWMAIASTCASLIALAVAGIAVGEWGAATQEAAKQAQVNCQRTVEFTPFTAAFFITHRVFPTTPGSGTGTHSVQDDYSRTIPKDCPK